MARRYGPDGQRLWNGKKPGSFTGNDTRQFIADTQNLLNGKDNTNMATTTRTAPEPTKTATAPAVEEQAQPAAIEVTVRPIEPRGKLIGFATVTLNLEGGKITIPDFKVFNGEKGLFVGNPSMKDPSAQSGYRDTARLLGSGIKDTLNVLARDAYVAEVEALRARAAAVLTAQPPRIKEQLDKAGQEADKANAARPDAPVRGAPARAERE